MNDVLPERINRLKFELAKLEEYNNYKYKEDILGLVTPSKAYLANLDIIANITAEIGVVQTLIDKGVS